MRMTPRVIVKKLIRRWSISSSARCCDRHALLMISWFITMSQNNVSDNGSDWCSDTTRRRDLHQECLPDNKISTHPYVSPSTIRSSPRTASWIVPSHCLHLKLSATRDKSPLVNQFFYILCTEQSWPALLFHRHHRATFQSFKSSSHPFSLSGIHIQSFVKKASSPFSHTSAKLLHCWCHKY